jgi:pimeloyl-ACP methyl ester carboxylesterase
MSTNGPVSSSVVHRGCRLTYDLRGEGAPVLFIQGTAVHGDGWMPQIDGLRDRHACLSFDNRGMARSQPVGDVALTVPQMAEDARIVMDACGWDSAHVVGHSLGGLIAQQLALDAPRRVRTLSLLCTFANGRAATRMSWWLLQSGVRTSLGSKRRRRHAFLEIVMPPAVLANADKDAMAGELEPIFGHDLAVRPPVTMRQVSAIRAFDVTARLSELASIPTLVVGAAFDPIARPELVRALAEGIPNARLVTFDDAAHGVVLQHRARINALLADHFERALSPLE